MLLHRVTIMIPHHMGNKTVDYIRQSGIGLILTENGRCVRLRQKKAAFLWGKKTTRPDDSPMDILSFDLPPESSSSFVNRLVCDMHMDVPGNGTVYIREANEYIATRITQPLLPPDTHDNQKNLLEDLALITVILSAGSSAERFAQTALELGTGIPVITLGEGTGIRDRLGLLRITVSPEKELVSLVVPAMDAEGITRVLIEEQRLNRPGKGFIYSSPVLRGHLDTSLRTGVQSHQASMEQIIAAIDNLKSGTSWRRRFMDQDRDSQLSFFRDFDEIVLLCPEEKVNEYASAAIRAGAGGATTLKVRRLGDVEAGSGARQRFIVTVPGTKTQSVVDALLSAVSSSDEDIDSLCIQPAPFAYTYRA